MKTSLLLFLVSIGIVVMGLVSYNVLLKKEYDKIDWSNPYQFYKPLPIRAVSYLVLNGNPYHEFLIEYHEKPAALVRPEDSSAVKYRQEGDTLFIDYKPLERYSVKPKLITARSLPTRIVVRLPTLKQIIATKGHLVVQNFDTDSLTLNMSFTRLTLFKVKVRQHAQILLQKESFAEFFDGPFNRMKLHVRDDSGFDLHDAKIIQFEPVISDKSEVRLSGQALKWLNWKRQ